MEYEARSGCPIANSLDAIGDRWTLIILRDLLNGKKRFNDFMTSPERITSSVLSDRLETMERFGLVSKAPYQLRPRRFEYALTPKGEALLPVLQALCLWANQHIPGTWIAPEAFMKRTIQQS